MGQVILEAWSKGARFDSWTEEFKGDVWAAAFASIGAAGGESAGPSAEELAATPLPFERALPWEIISGVGDHAYLLKEWERAGRGRPPPTAVGTVAVNAGPARTGRERPWPTAPRRLRRAAGSAPLAAPALEPAAPAPAAGTRLWRPRRGWRARVRR